MFPAQSFDKRGAMPTINESFIKAHIGLLTKSAQNTCVIDLVCGILEVLAINQ